MNNTKENEVEDYIKFISEKYRRVLYYFYLYKHLYNSVGIDKYGKEIAERNVEIRNTYPWILGVNVLNAYINLTIIELYGLFDDKKERKGINKLLNLISNNIYKINNINYNHLKDKGLLNDYKEITLDMVNNIKKQIKPYRNIIENNLKNLRDKLAHNTLVIDKQSNISIKDLEEILLIVGNILNELTGKIESNIWYFDGFSENIQNDYENLFNDLSYLK